jgi:hypothetical protein
MCGGHEESVLRGEGNRPRGPRQHIVQRPTEGEEPTSESAGWYLGVSMETTPWRKAGNSYFLKVKIMR